MSIEEEGFFSPWLSDFVVKHRTENADWFPYAEKLNRTAQRLLLSTSVTVNSSFDAKLFARLLFTRVLSNFQGAVLLSERGMIVEARTLARSCLESTFCLAATAKGDSEFLHEMFLEDMNSRKKLANWLLRRDHLLEHVEGAAENRLREFVGNLDKDLAKFSPRGIEDMAKRGDIHNMYLYYRILSGEAAHPTFTALMRYIGDEGDQTNLPILWGPDCGTEKIRDTVGWSCLFLILACDAINKVHKNSEAEQELAQHFDEYKRIASAPAVGRAATSR